MRTLKFIVLSDLQDEQLICDMSFIMDHYNDDSLDEENMMIHFYRCIHQLIEIAEECGFYGNLWHCYLTNLMVNNENSYSLGCEMKGTIEGNINDAFLHDMVLLKELYDFDFKKVMKEFHVPEYLLTLNYETYITRSKVYNSQICKRICELAEDLGNTRTPEAMKEKFTEFYGEHGVGKIGLHKAFRIGEKEKFPCIEPILNMEHVHLDDLVGYEIPKKKLIENTEAFVSKRNANNCLLYGDAGTGKSSCMKAITNEYYEKGLRVIEVYKHQFRELNEVISQIKNRNYRFIIYMDDLSFEDFEIEYKYLKAIIEGGLEKKPENVLIYATSNRRHLVREKYSDKEERKDDLHASDTVQEKLSLVARFGVTIYFGAPSQKQFQEIVKKLAVRNGLNMGEEELLKEANKWELSHGGLSGRTAQQFIDYLLGSGENRFVL